MALKLRGNAWYLRKSVNGKLKEFPLRIYGGEDDRARAEKAASKMSKNINEGKAAKKVLGKPGLHAVGKKAPAPTFAEWWEEYRVSHGREKNEDTQRRDAQVMVPWLALLGSKRLDEITSTDCLRAVQARRKAHTAHKNRKTKKLLAEDTVQRERNLIQAILARAIENGTKGIDKNPMKGVGGRKKGEKAPEDEPKLIAAMRKPVKDAVGRKVRMHERYVRFVQLLLQTGLRIDELLNEHFRDEGDSIHVKGKFAKERDVALTRTARATLDEQWKDTGSEGSRRPKDGGPWWQNQQRFRAVMAKASTRAGIAHLSPHDLRHTFGHRYLTKYSGDIQTLSKILGHASVAVTERHYAYLRKEDVRDKMLAAMEPARRVPTRSGLRAVK
jgi:integrase